MSESYIKIGRGKKVHLAVLGPWPLCGLSSRLRVYVEGPVTCKNCKRLMVPDKSEQEVDDE